MNEITKVVLENEMDLILAHKQSMRLAELAGLSLAAQTTFATAVSEVSRSAINMETDASLILYVSDKREQHKYIIGVLQDNRSGFSELKDAGYQYAKRLVQNINASITANGYNRIELNYRLPATVRIDDISIEKWRINLNTDPAISPYEEIKRKNRQLVEMADKLREREQQYKSLTDSLPLMIYTMNNDGALTYANQWLHEYTGETIEALNETRWGNTIHPDDLASIMAEWEKKAGTEYDVVNTEARFRNVKTNEYRWHTGIATAMKGIDGAIASWNAFMVDIHAQKAIEETLKDNQQLKEIHTELEEKVKLLNQSNQQLEQFAYVASHDLQEPLRKISFYSDYLKSKYGRHMPAEAQTFFDNLMNATDRMKVLIQDVLSYSTVRNDGFDETDLNEIGRETLQDLEISISGKNATVLIGPLPVIEGNARQMKQLFENLISNALKFAKAGVKPVINISATLNEHSVMLSFEDNGIGFEDKYVQKMFDLFQRLHTRDKYSGTGIGLAICKKITDMHYGSITAKGEPGVGATFLVNLPLRQVNIQKFY